MKSTCVDNFNQTGGFSIKRTCKFHKYMLNYYSALRVQLWRIDRVAKELDWKSSKV